MVKVNREDFMYDLYIYLLAQGVTQIRDASSIQMNQAIALATSGFITRNKQKMDMPIRKQACYLSAEFLLGRLVFNNLMNLGILNDVRDWLEEEGYNLDALEDLPDPALGNGGLGRLAACFLDSAATVGVPMMGYGIRYAYGLFRQKFEDGFQVEEADDWGAGSDPWSVRRDDIAQTIKFADMTVRAVPYDMPIFGYKTSHTGTLRLFQAEPLEQFDFKLFDSGKYDEAVRDKNRAEDISRLLYPNDSSKDGKKLRLRQEYFFAAASVRDMIRRFLPLGIRFDKLPDKFAVQLNDTHPVIAIPEFIRILMDEAHMAFDDSFDIALQTFNYTNHTIMEEALEKWDAPLMKSILPRIYEIIALIEKRFKDEREGEMISKKLQEQFAIVSHGQVHMARLAIYASGHTNGVSKVHTDILKFKELEHWNDAYPTRFYNMTNGISQRRWLGLANPRLTEFLNCYTHSDVLLDSDKLADMYRYQFNDDMLEEFALIKRNNKRDLTAYISRREGRLIDAGSLFDVQVKRLHEYKRQLMNALHIIMLIHEIEEGVYNAATPPLTFIFGAKAAPGYRRAKAIIKLINEIAKLIESSPALSDRLCVVFVTDYNVSYAERIVSSADLSEQISMAGTEASGTGNMKLMMNGTPTIGTYDGANVEIVEAAGPDYNYIFGATVEELELILPTYDPMALLAKNPKIARALDELIDGRLSDGGTGMFKELYDSLRVGAAWHKPDHYYVLGDIAAYDEARKQAFLEFNHGSFIRKSFMNMCAAGMFSSDNTIIGYAKNIWGINSTA